MTWFRQSRLHYAGTKESRCAYCASRGSGEHNTVLLVTTLHLTDVVENASDDILAAMRVTVAHFVEVTLKH